MELVLQRIHPDDRALMSQAIDETSRGENDFDVTTRLLMPDSSVKYVHVLSDAIRDGSGNLEVVGALTDVTAMNGNNGWKADLKQAAEKVPT